MHIVHMCTCNNWSTYESCMWNNSRALEKRPCSAKETCVFKEPTNNSHHVCTIRTWEACSWKTEFNHEISILSHTRMCCVFAGYYGISTHTHTPAFDLLRIVKFLDSLWQIEKSREFLACLALANREFFPSICHMHTCSVCELMSATRCVCEWRSAVYVSWSLQLDVCVS